LGFYCSEAATRFFIRDYLLENFEQGVIPALKLLMQILKLQDEEVFDIIKEIGEIPTFTLSWLLTWYSHVLFEFKEV